MSAFAGIGGASIVLAVVASVGGFGCLCNVVASHRCGGDEEDFPTLRQPDPSDADGGDPDASESRD